MRTSAIIFLLLVFKYCSAQSDVQKFMQAEEINSPELLSQLLTATDTTDRQKVNSIFNWITQNISYNVKRFENTYTNRYATVPDEEDEDETAPLKPLYERIAILVLKRRTAVCSGYANLFKSLCMHAGIPCEVITGLGKSNAGRLDKRFTSNHRWNAVFFDTVWHLLDATWASGYINSRNEFQREYNPHYFLTAPGEFINDHYPEDMRWTLLPQDPLLNEFMYSPFKTTGFNKFYIKSFSPLTGIIEANIGDSILFEIDAVRPETLWISDLSYADSNTVFLMQCCGAVKPLNKVSGKKVNYTYHITSAKTEWLHVVYDDEIIMRYKLNIKKESPVEMPALIEKGKPSQ